MKGKIKVLVIDDEEIVANILSESLKMEGFEVDIASDGEDGIRKVNLFRPDYIVLDCLMPRMDGFEFCKILRADSAYSHIKLIMMSAVFTDQPFIKETINTYHPEAFFVKPFEVKDLVKYLRPVAETESHLVADRRAGRKGSTIEEIIKLFKPQGSFAEINFLTILYYAVVLKSTGILTVLFNNMQWVIYFYQGKIVKTVSNIRSEFFGSIAVKLGYLSEKDKEECIEIAKEKAQKIGDTMVSRKKLKPETMIEILEAQAEVRLRNLITLDTATYSYQLAFVNKTPKLYLQFDILNFIARASFGDQELYFKQKFEPYLKLVPQINKSALIQIDAFMKMSFQRAVVDKIDGKNSIETILMLFQKDRANVLFFLYSLIMFDFIHFPIACEERETFTYLKSQLDKFKRANYFGVLGVALTSSDDDVKKAYVEMAKEYHPDKNIQRNEPAIKSIAEEIFGIITMAYQALQTAKGRKEYEASLTAGVDKMTVDKAFSSETSFMEGVRFFKKNMIKEAKEYFEKVYKTNPKNLEYCAYLAWMRLFEEQNKKGKKLEEIKKMLEENLAVSPKHEVTNLVLGYLFKYDGNFGEAINHFEAVVAVNKDNLDAKRELRLIKKRTEKKKLLNINIKLK